MSFPESLKQDFDVLDGSPTGRILPCYRVRERKPFGREFMMRLLPDSFCSDKGIVDAFHEFFTRFSEISNKTYIAQLHSVVGAANRSVYVLKEFLSGISLKEFVDKRKDSKDFEQDAINIISRVCEALHSSHQKDVFHLSVAPEDILVDENNPEKVKLVGFGAQLFASKGKLDYLSSEARKYLAPEVLKRGIFGPKADVYSLAVTIKELFPEFAEASGILDKATSATLKDRFVSARQFAANFKELAIADPVADPTPKSAKPTKAVKPKGGLQPILKVTTDPPGATVIADGQVIGKTTITGFSFPWNPGKTISFEKTGYETETLSLDRPPEKPTIQIKLNPAVRLFTNPWGATIKINGELLGTTTYKGLMIPWDKGEIVIEKQGFKSETLRFNTVPSGNETCVELKLRATPATQPLPEKPARPLHVEHEPRRSTGKLLTSFFESASRVFEPLRTLWSRFRSSNLLAGHDAGTVGSLLFIGVLVLLVIISSRNTQNQPNKQIQVPPITYQRPSQSQPETNVPPHPTAHPVDSTELILAAESGDDYKVRTLLAQGTDPNATTINGHTALMMASANGHLEIVRALIKAGADVNLKSRLGATALDFAKQHNHDNILSLLNTQSGGQPATPLPNQPTTITAGLGIAIEKLPPDVASKMMPSDRHGFVVKSVISDGIGGKMGLRSGDVIIEVDGTTFADMVGLDKLWVASTRNGVIRVKIRRGTAAIFLAGSLN